MDTYQVISQELRKLLTDGVGEFTLVQPDEALHGEYSTNIAFIVAKEKNLSPKFCANEMQPILEKALVSVVERVEVAGPGFLNFFLQASQIQKENKKNTASISTIYTGKNVLVEHSSPNLFKPFSVGHLMNNIVGEFVARAIARGGGKVITMSFPSDYSLGIAKAMFIILKDKKDIKYFTETSEDEIIAYLGDAYVRGVKECEDNENSLNESKKILDEMYNHTSDDFHLLFVKIRGISESYFRKVLAELGSAIDDFQYESFAGYKGKKIVQENTGEGKVFTESEGAIVYIPDEARKDLHTSVFINSQGYPTYEAKDLGLLEIKFRWLNVNNFYPDISYFITDQEQTSHFKVVLDAAFKLGGSWQEWVEKSIHIPHGRMLFKGEKMSSRLGGVPLALDVIGVVEEEVKERAGEKIAHLGEQEREKLEREIALSALRIAVLRSKPGININFDPETSLSFEGDSGPYLLYTHARCTSLLEKGLEKKYAPTFGEFAPSNLERQLASFEIVLTETINTLSPQKMVTYLFKVGQNFNTFYANNQIISDDKVASEHNLAIAQRTRTVLKEGLEVLGITAPEKM